jgi:hypothetical protein
MIIRLSIYIILTWLIAASPALAVDLHSGLMERWYGALAVAEREEIAALLSPDAIIELEDIGVTQTSAEFVASMDEWAEAISGGSIRHRIENDGVDTVEVTVCYTFTSNVMMTTESFVFAGRQIVSSRQKTVATNCDGFE